VFVAIGAIALVVAWPLHRAASAWPQPTPGGTTRGGLAAYLGLLRRRSARLLVTAVLVEGFFFYGALPYGGALLHARFGLNYLEIGLILAAFGVGGLGYSVAVKWLVRTLGERGMVLAGALVVAAAYVAIALAPHWAVVAAALGVGGFFFYMLHSTFQTLATELAPESRGVAVSLFVFMVLAGTAIGVAALGRLVAHGGYSALFLVAAAGITVLGLWFQRHIREFKARA
jgi:predicted MFS family arabinose efflux permease